MTGQKQKMTREILGQRPWRWIHSGWTLFLRQPAGLIAVSVLCVVIAFVCSHEPAVGKAVMAMISPALFAIFLYGVSELHAGRQIEAGSAVRFLGNSKLVLRLLLLGLLPLAVQLLSRLLHLTGILAPGIISTLTTLLSLLAICGLLYGLPLVLFSNMPAFPAFLKSLAISAGRPLDIAVFFALAIVLAVLAAIPFGMGLLILFPVLAGAVYTSYRENAAITGSQT